MNEFTPTTMELDDASIASFATARVYKVIRLLSCEGDIERRDGEQEHRSCDFKLLTTSLARPLSLLSSASIIHLPPPPPKRAYKPTQQSDPPSRINSLCFHRTSPLLFAASDEDASLRVIDSSTGDLKSTVPCPKHGVSLVVATHAPTAVLHASNRAFSSQGKEEENAAAALPPHERLLDLHAARYLDLHSNAYLRYFQGHAARLCALSLSPSDDSFVSAAVDGTVRFWDLRAPVATGALDLPPTRRAVGVASGGGANGRLLPAPPSVLLPAAAPAVAHEEQGMVLAISAGAGAPLRLFDARAIDKGPFATLPEAGALPPLAAPRPAAALAPPPAAGGTGGPPAAMNVAMASPDPDRLVFSPDGDAIAVAGGGGLLVLDSFKGTVIARLLPGAPPPPVDAEGGGGESSPAPFPSSSSASPSSASTALTPAWSPCGRYVVSGCSDGAIRAWKVRGRGGGGHGGGGGAAAAATPRGPVTPAPSATWLGHAEAPGALSWSPRTQMAASGDNSALALWVPGPGSLEGER